MKIRKASLKELEAITKMHLGLIRFEAKISPVFKTLDRKRLGELKKWVKKSISKKQNGFLLIAEKDGMLVGFVYAEIEKRPSIYTVKKIGHIHEIFVIAEERGKGVGKKLLQEALKRLKKQGIKHTTIEVLSKNKNAVKTYQALGFKEFKKKMRKKL